MSETETREDRRIEAAARALAGLAEGEDWPTNAALGGGLTGTRDDEYRDETRAAARLALAAADAVGESAVRAEVARLREAVEAFDPCQGGDELHEVHERVCVPWYERRDALLASGGSPLRTAVAALADEWERDEAYACVNASECLRCVSFQRAVIRLRAVLGAPVVPSGKSHVEIGGQRMTEAQYEAARRPLLDGVASAAEADRLREVWGRSDWDGSEDSMRSVPSGEAESGERPEGEAPNCVDCGCPDDQCDVGTCCDGCYESGGGTHSPAPVSSGGQADGEGERLRPDEIERLDFNYQVGDGRWLYEEIEGIIARRLSARPVLSREAVARIITREHFDLLRDDAPRSEIQDAGLRAADAVLAAVLVGQEER